MSEFQAVTRHGLYLAALIATAVPSGAQTTAAGNADAASGPTVTIQPLTKYALADGTASVMLPEGWRVTQTGVAFIRAEGPKGEIAMFGVTVPAHDGAAGGAGPPTPLSQPYDADAGDKLNQTIQWERAANNLSPVRVIKIYSEAPFNAPPELGICSKLTTTLGVGRSGVLDAEADLCSMPKDKAGNYTNFLKIIAIAPALAKTERATLEAALASYVVNMKAVQKHVAQSAKQPTKMAAAANMSGNSSANNSANPGAMSANRSANPLTPQGRQSLQQQIDSEIKAGGFSPQMVAAMRAQANRMAAATMGPALRQMQGTNQAVDYFDRTTLRGEIPLSITNQGTFWLDPN
jgi:hypothetical protein